MPTYKYQLHPDHQQRDADVRFIQAMLGHADLKSIQIYTYVAVQQLKAIHTAIHPAKTRQQAAKYGTEPDTGDDEDTPPPTALP